MDIEELRYLTNQLIDSEDRLKRSEANLTTFFNSITEMAIVFDLNLNIIAFNDSFSASLKYDIDDIKRLTLYDLINDQDKNDVLIQLEKIKSGGLPVTCDICLYRSDGTSFIAEVKSLLSTWDGVSGIICIARDITDRIEHEKKLILQAMELEVYNEELRATENELTTRNNFLESMISAIPIPIYYKSMNNVFIDCNKAFENFYGASKQYIVGKTTKDLFPEYAAELEKQDLLLLVNSTRTVCFKHVIHDKDMKAHDYVIIKTLHLNFKNEPLGIIGTAVCIHHPLLGFENGGVT